MKLFEALKEVHESNTLMASLDQANKEIFIIENYTRFEIPSELIIWYSKETGPYEGEEGSFSPEEFILEFPDHEKLEFTEIGKAGIDALFETWEYAKQTIIQNIIKARK
jgi:hypothetical protein